MSGIIIDIIFILIMLGCMSSSREKGFVKTVYNTFSGVIAFLSALLFSGGVSQWINEKYIYDGVRIEISDIVNNPATQSDIPKIFAIIEEKWKTFINLFEIDFHNIGQSALKNGESAIKYIIQEISSILSNGISSIIGFVGILIASYIVLRLLYLVLENIMHLPILKTVNNAAGLAAGFVNGCVICFIIACAMIGVSSATNAEILANIGSSQIITITSKLLSTILPIKA